MVRPCESFAYRLECARPQNLPIATREDVAHPQIARHIAVPIGGVSGRVPLMRGVGRGCRSVTLRLWVLDQGMIEKSGHCGAIPLPIHGIKVGITKDDKVAEILVAQDVFP